MTTNISVFDWINNYNFLLIDEVDLLEKKKVQAKEIFVLSTTVLFWEICIKRIQELNKGYLHAKKNNLQVNMCLMSRAAIETFSVGAVQILNVESLLQSGFRNKRKLNEYEERCRKLFLGLRGEDNPKAITATNIRTHLEKIDKFLKEIQLDFLLDAYSDLSNMCHPNLSGMMGNYYTKVVNMVTTNGESKHPTYFEALLMTVQHFDRNLIQDFRSMIENDGKAFFC